MSKKRKTKYSKKVIIICIISIWFYILLNAFLLLHAGVVMPDLLTGFFFSVFGLEFFSLASIKKAEINKSVTEKTVSKDEENDLELEIQNAIDKGM